MFYLYRNSSPKNHNITTLGHVTLTRVHSYLSIYLVERSASNKPSQSQLYTSFRWSVKSGNENDTQQHTPGPPHTHIHTDTKHSWRVLIGPHLVPSYFLAGNAILMSSYLFSIYATNVE